jgi:hypothetical protein
MTVQRLTSLLSLFVVALLLTGCPDDKKKMPIIDVTEDGVGEVETGDIAVDVDGDVVEPPLDLKDEDTEPADVEVIEDEISPPEPQLSFCLTTSSGCLSEFDGCLTLADDQSPGVAGLQVNINVTTANIAQGSKVELWVDEILVDSINKPFDEFSFSQVTLSHKPDGHVIEVRVPGTINAQLSVCAETGSCGITLEPANDACLTLDADTEAEGFQAEFIITSDGSDCSQAWLEVGGDQPPTAAVDLVDGSATIVVTLAESDVANCLDVDVTGVVSDPDNPDRQAELGPVTFSVDSQVPVVTILEPTKNSVNLLQDEDPDNVGIQVSISGTVEQFASQDSVELWLDDELTDTATADDGSFLFVATLFDAGPHTIEVRVTDCCGQTGSAEKILIAVLSESDLSIGYPGADDVLLAVDNGDAGSDTVYAIDFTLLAPISDVGDTLVVQCRSDAPGSLYKVVGQFTIDALDEEWLYKVPVLLDVNKLGNGVLCRARAAKDEGFLVSADIALTIGLPAPWLTIEEPVDGAILDPVVLAVSGAALNLEGQELTIALAGPEESTWTTTAGAAGYAASKAVIGLPDGDYTLSVSGTDLYGNVAQDQPDSMATISITLDGTAPTLVFVDPSDGDTCTPPGCVDTVPGEVLMGHQIEVILGVSGEADPESVKVCLTANGALQAPCAIPVDDNGQWVATFFGVTLIAGNNVLTATATDGLGHKSDPVTAEVTLNVDAPRVTFTTPTKDLIVGAEPIEVVVSVSSPDATVPHADAQVTLYVAGEVYDTSAAGPDGLYTFSMSGLNANVPTLLQASATHPTYADEGFSDLRKVTLKDTLPTVAITSPEDGKLFNLAATGCAVGAAGCKLTVTASTANVEDGQEGTLNVDCGAVGSLSIDAVVMADALSFKAVPLPDNALCSLTVEITDAVGKTATSAAVVVTIDRTAPVVTKFVLPETALVPASFDADPNVDGFQYSVVVKAKGLEIAQDVTLSILHEEADNPSQLITTLTETIGDGLAKNVFFDEFSFVGGLNTLTVTVTDKAGNTGSLSKDFLFFTDPTEVKFYKFESVEFKECATSAECGTGVCATVSAGKRCVTPWKDAKQVVTVITTPGELFEGPQQLRFCSNHGSLTSEVCGDTSQGQFRVLKTFDLIGGFEGVTFQKTEVKALPQGEHKVFLEAKSNEDGSWYSSLASSSLNEQFKVLYVDTEAPTVGSVSFPGDVAPNDGWLNILEAVAGNVFGVAVAVTGAGEGTATFAVNNQAQPALAVPAGAMANLAAELSLFQGANEVCITAKDLVGNSSNKTCGSINVDTIAPALSFTYPQGNGTLLAGSSADVKLTTEPNLEVTLAVTLDGAATEQKAAANAQGNVTFAGALAADGTYVLSASVGDTAANVSAAVTNPPQILVDRTPPTLSLEGPAEGTALTQGDDAAAEVGGYQVQVQFTTDATSWTIETLRCTDNTYANCEAPVLKEQGSSQGAQSVLITLTKLLSGMEYRIIRVTAMDDNGNDAVVETTISLQQGDCIVVFTNLPETDFINNSYCAVAGEDCASVSFDAEVSIVGACGADLVVFYVDDVPAAQSADLGLGTVSFPISVADGGQIMVEAKLMLEGSDIGAGTGAFTYTADLTDPLPVLVAPAANPFTCNIAVDDNDGVEGCQFAAEAEVTDDNLIGGELQILQTVAGNDTVLADELIDAAPFSASFGSLTLPEGADQTLTLRAIDLAGNTADVSISATVDVTAPATIELSAIQAGDIDPRLPMVDLAFAAVADDAAAGPAAASYEVAYSASPINNDADFDAACDASDLAGTAAFGTPKAPGGVESLVVSGPDSRAASDPCYFAVSPTQGKQYWFAVRAVDDLGNVSKVNASSVQSTSGLTLSYAKVNTDGLDAPAMGSWVWDLGDLNGDEMNEFAVAGDTAFSGFCIVKGHANLEAEIVVADAANDPNVECYQDGPINWEGFHMAPVGDVNGDGINDIASLVYVNDAGEYNTYHKIYLGDGNGFVEPTAAVRFTFTGVDYWQGQITSAGNFTGDTTQDGKPIYDVAVGAPEVGKVFIIPGSTSWKSTAPVSIDLLDPAALTAWKVLTISGVGMSGEMFGDNVANVGNLLADNGGEGTQYDDVAIAKTTGSSAVYVVKGRALPASAAISVSLNLDGAGTEDAAVVKLRADAGQTTGSYYFGQEVQGNLDVTGDGIPDIMVAHHSYNAFETTQVYIFSGAAVPGALGTFLRVNATQSVGNGVFMGANGFRIVGAASYFALAGDFDTAGGATASIDLVHTDFLSAAELGHVYVRLNRQEFAEAGNVWRSQDLVITDPFTDGNVDFGGYNFRPVGDVNGDGAPDLVVGSKLLGYSVIVY